MAALAGLTSPLRTATLLLIALAFVCLDPSGFRQRKVSGWWFLAPLLLASLAFLPNAWIHQGFHAQIEDQLNLSLPSTTSPEPWLAAEGLLILAANLLWGFYLLNRRWSWDCAALMKLQALAITGIAVAAIAKGCFHFLSETGQSSGRFGFFADRNQTGNLFGITAIIVFALGFSARRPAETLLWLGAELVLGGALILNHSRAGIVLAFGGCTLWTAATLLLGQLDREKALKGGSLLIGITLIFFAFASQLTARLLELSSVNWGEDFRVLVQKDALRLIADSRWTGVGLGNFEHIFGLYRDFSMNHTHVVHPESDWLLLAAEMGAAGVLVFFIPIAMAIRNAFSSEPTDALRTAAVVGAALFMAHGLVDVSGHGMGTVWPILLLIAVCQTRTGAEVEDYPGRRPAVIGACLTGILLAAWATGIIPGTPRLNQLETRMVRELGNGRYSELHAMATEAIRIAPLDWRWHEYQGLAASDVRECERAFGLASVLEPGSPELPLQQYLFLRPRHPELAWVSLAEVLDRADHGEAWLDRLAELCKNDPRATEELWRNTRNSAANQLLILRKATPSLRSSFIAGLVRDNPTLAGWSAPERHELFRLWEQSDSWTTIPEYLDGHAGQAAVAWPYLVRVRIREGSLLEAAKLIRQWQPVPNFARTDPDAAAPARAVNQKPEAWAKGLAAWKSLTSAGSDDRALGLARDLVRENPSMPHLNYLLYRSCDSSGQFGEACTAWLRYDEGVSARK